MKLPLKTLPNETELRKFGFTDHLPTNWYFTKRLEPLKYSVSFNLSINKETLGYSTYILDEDFGQPYHFRTFDKTGLVEESIKKVLTDLSSIGLNIDFDFQEYEIPQN